MALPSHQVACDSYFVDTHDAPVDPRAAAQEYVKMMGRRKQQAMANLLSSQACDEYLLDMVKHMMQMEDDTLPDVASIDIQEEIQWFMRPYLVDFLIEAHAAFQLLPETLFLAVNLLDRYCSRRVVYKRHYQLVGCAALLIAAKYGDKKDKVPLIRELTSMCCGLYDAAMFTQMEWHVLNTLDWVVGHPTVDTWIQIALLEGPPSYADAEVEHLAWYICEMALYHKDFVSTRPSHMAHAALALARRILGRPEPPRDAVDATTNATYAALSRMLNRPSTVLARKYSSPHLSRVATTLEHFLARQAALQRCIQPPTPPLEMSHAGVAASAVTPEHLRTPQKMPYGHLAHGYPTPPITPEGAYFMAGTEQPPHTHFSAVPRCPVTPSPPQPTYAHDAYMHHPQPQPFPSYQHDMMMH